MEPLAAEVHLVVKAANQQTPDVKIQAQSAWSVLDLKLHLAQNYPNKPIVEEQKIIYSGRLLPDSALLKDVLRQYEGVEVHTLHLVWAKQRNSYANTSAPSSSSAPAAESSGVRRRNVAEANAAQPETQNNQQNANVDMQNYYAYMMSQYTRAVPPVPAHYQQMLLMQQAYAQYMQQYANMWQATAGGMNAAQPVNVQNEPEDQRAAPALDGEEDAELAGPRDWLDWVYAMSRVAILATLLYLYSNLYRLGFVILMLAALFFQLGGFRDNQNRNRNAGQRQRDAPANPETIDNANASQPQNTEQQSVLGATWMIVTSFFTSLVPEIPNVV